MQPDPKPNLGRAGILANLNYWNSLENKYSKQYSEALEQSTYWLRELEQLESTEQRVTPL